MAGIPVLNVAGNSLAETWEKSLVQLFKWGVDVATQYDTPGDPPSKDCTMMIVVEDPLAEPMIHMDMPGGFEDLQEYVMEVCDGIKDHWVRDPSNPDDKKWEYTYHDRLFNYTVTTRTEAHAEGEIWMPESPGTRHINQIYEVCDQLAKCLYTRRAQAITWKVWEDLSCYDPPCLQSIWCRILPGDELFLNMNVRFRSRDAYKAAFMNMFALIMLQKRMADRIAEKIGREVKLGRYVDFSDSYHIYGKNLNEFNQRFLRAVQERPADRRMVRYCDLKELMDNAIPSILKKVEETNV